MTFVRVQAELAFGEIDGAPCREHAEHDELEMFNMLFDALAVAADVVHIGRTIVQQGGVQDSFDMTLKGRSCLL